MIILNESILVDRPIQEVFKFTTEFSNIEQWDPSVASSLKRSSEAVQVGTKYDLILKLILQDWIHYLPVQVGTQYDLILKYGLFRPKMQYRITHYEPYSKVVLKGSGESYSATDTISFFGTNAGTRIDYQAKIEFSGWASKIEPLLFPFSMRIGKNAIRGLEKTLDPAISLQKRKTIFSSGTNMIDYLADHAILPGMIGFSKFGFALSKAFWRENTGILSGKQVVITGGTSGIGKAAAFELARKNAVITIIARNRKKAMQVQREITEQTGNTHIGFLVADLSLMADIRVVAERLIEQEKKIDILINNAGALFNERMETTEGF